MEVQFSGRVVDLSKFEKHSDIITFLETIEPTETLDLGKLNPKKPSEEDFYLLDTMTGQEKAIISFLSALGKFRDGLLEKLHPYDRTQIMVYMITGERPVEERKFDVKTYQDYNKVYLFYGVAKRYFDFVMHSRIGFDTFLEYDADGNVYTAKDLRGTLS